MKVSIFFGSLNFYVILKNIFLFYSGVRDFPCDVCGKGFVSKNDMQRHKLYVHEGRINFMPKREIKKSNYCRLI